jgi:hypothetical protein
MATRQSSRNKAPPHRYGFETSSDEDESLVSDSDLEDDSDEGVSDLNEEDDADEGDENIDMAAWQFVTGEIV